MKRNGSQRRRFLTHCGSLLGALALSRNRNADAGERGTMHRFGRSLLVDGGGAPFDATALDAGVEYLFHYPYVTTPCFLIDLGRRAPGGDELKTEDGASYRWRGGVGPNGSVVAFSAICAHRMTHPTPGVSFIGYRKTKTGFYDNERRLVQRRGVIQCCSEQSVYDPAQGAKVLGGPAPQPLASIALEFDERGRMHAVGVYGGMLFERYFDHFGKRLVVEYQRLDIDSRTGDTTEVLPIEQFTRKRVSCA